MGQQLVRNRVGDQVLEKVSQFGLRCIQRGQVEDGQVVEVGFHIGPLAQFGVVAQ